MEHEQMIPGVARRSSAVPRYAWVVLAVVYLMSVAAPLNQFKVPPVMPVLIETLHFDLGNVGLLMSVFAITGFVLALPSGVIVQRLGLKPTGLIAGGCLMAGAVAGALAPNAGLLLASRVVEGMGMGLVAVVAPAAVAAWFPPDSRGTPMGLWATWVPAGNIFMFVVAPPLAASAGWRSVWWVGAGFAAAAMVLFWIFMRPPQTADAGQGGGTGAAQPGLRKALANRSIWLLGLEFACFNLPFLAVVSFYPTFLTTERDYTLAAAAFIAALVSVFSIVSAPSAGWLSDRIGSRKPLYTLPFLVTALMTPFLFRLNGALIPASMIALGLMAGTIPAATFASVPDVMGTPALAGLGMAVIALGQNLGMVIGPGIFGPLVESVGWVTASYWLIPVLLLGALSGWLVKTRQHEATGTG